MSGLGEEAALETRGGIGVDPTKACEEVALPGVDGLPCLVGTVVVGQAQLEVYSIGLEETLEGLGALVVNAEGLGLEATV